MKTRIRAWLARNQEAIDSVDGYPPALLRQQLFALVTPGCKVGWLDPYGSLQHGTVMILTKGSHAAVHITGSSGARPGLVDAVNIIWCANAPYRLSAISGEGCLGANS